MDNHKLLKEIGAGLEVMAGQINAALTERKDDRWRRDDRIECDSEICPHYDGGGRCSEVNMCLISGTIKPGQPCNEPCDHSVCTYAINQLCVFSDTCGEHSKPPEDRLQGHTLAQWDEIRKGGYLCQFSTCKGGTWSRLDTIRDFNSPSDLGPFINSGGAHYTHCRPAQIPGVLRPWFGGDCPVDPSARVLMRVRSSSRMVIQEASTITWGHGGAMGAELEIVAYMEV